MRSRQAGMTFLGILVLIFVVGTWVYAGMRITPIYLNYMKVAATLEKVRDELASNPETTDFMIRKGIERHFNIEQVDEDVFNYPDVVIKRDGDKFKVRAAYEAAAPFAFNIQFLLTFDKTVDIPVR